ncbi:aldo/keto reductase [Noviherbaspirillum aridicola]|uniref:Aldo/keto reductase n=1 Tax=Noviherbaspirillum aridicola TaxID=2849687 RepID=A0ABQ4Q6A8_9BURK|nr:aldo/keto reductase [Noviherbaspirillum aridicola]GIZ52728.1 aldo/keto reductase [Noviherbaspirillum aridicola]
MNHASNERPSKGGMSRAEFLRLAMGAAVGLGLGPGLGAQPAPARMLTRRIPSSGEALPVIGVGTWQTFDAGPGEAERAPLREVLQVLFAAGGSVIDSSPMYGRSEEVAGDLLAGLGVHERAFVATKVWTRGREEGIRQMRRSMQLLRDERIELMQVHNLVDWRTQLRTLRTWKEEGRIRYLGVTHYTESAYDELEAVMRGEKLDFVQLNYALNDRAAEARLLPLAAERGIAVLVNQPFGGGGLLRGLAAQPLPDWAAEIGCESWAQVLLKFVLGHPAVTCVIPGTSRPRHMADNCRAGTGVLPDDSMRKRIVAWWEGRR